MMMAPQDSFDESASEAGQLLESWERLGRAHMMIGAACACGIGGVVVALEDFEQDIADYLQGEAERLDRADVLKYLNEQGREGEQWSISKLLAGLAGPARRATHAAEADFLLKRLARTLQSFEKLHGSS
jgi:hypothetical protein